MTYFVIKSSLQTLEDCVFALYTRRVFDTFEEAQAHLEEHYEDTCKVCKLTVSYEYPTTDTIKANLTLEPCERTPNDQN